MARRSVCRPYLSLPLLLVWVVMGCTEDPGVDPDAGPGGGGQGGSVTEPSYGVPSDGCAQGFEPDGDHGCTPVLPQPCPPGLMAVPGETECRPVAPCADGTWGDIPVDGNTQYVDGSYAGGNSNGTAAQPWTSINDAINAAAGSAIVAIAAGSYAEEVEISDKAVRLWGRCPEMVEIVGPANAMATVFVTDSYGSELHDLAVRSDDGIGVLSSAGELLLERLWLHDIPNRGVSIEETLGSTTLVVRDSLVENVIEVGVFVGGSTATVERSVIRDVMPHPSFGFGSGMTVKPDTDHVMRATVVARQSLIERTHSCALQIISSDVTVDGCAVLDTLPEQNGALGIGVGLARDPAFGPPVVDLRGCVIERSHAAGISAEASVLSVLNTTIRDTQPQQMAGAFGNGIRVQNDVAAAMSSELYLTTSLVEDNHEVGVLGMDSAITLDGVLVRRTQTRLDGTFGDGVALVQSDGGATGTITGSFVNENARAGLANFGATLAIGGNRIRCSSVDLNGELNKTEFVYNDLGGNTCGCPEAVEACQVLSANLAPPEPL